MLHGVPSISHFEEPINDAHEGARELAPTFDFLEREGQYSQEFRGWRSTAKVKYPRNISRSVTGWNNHPSDWSPTKP